MTLVRSIVLLSLICVCPGTLAGNLWGEQWDTQLVWAADGAGATIPGPPTITSIESTIGGLIVFFTAPANNGGATITSYIATCASFSEEGSGSPITVDGLDGSTSYTCSVTAANSQGSGASSNVQQATTEAIPGLNIILIKAALDKKTER